MNMHRLSRSGIALAVPVAGLCFVWILFQIDSVHQRQKAERLISDIREFPFATADFSEVRAFVAEHGGAARNSDPANRPPVCSPTACDFDVSIKPTVTRLFRPRERLINVAYRPLACVGIRPWAITATFSIRNGVLQHVMVDFAQEHLDKMIWYFVDLDRTRTPHSEGENSSRSYAVTRPHVTEPQVDVMRVWAVLTPNGAWKRGFDVKLSCFSTILRGCEDMRQLAPSAEADYEAERTRLETNQK